jgi:HNH endonuclease
MDLTLYDLELLEERHYVDPMRRGITCAFSIELERFRARRETFAGNFCVILHADPEGEGDYFVIPYQELACVLSDANVADSVREGWKGGLAGTIARNSTLLIDGSKREVQIGSYYRKSDLLRWLIAGNDLFSFIYSRADEQAIGFPPYVSPVLSESGKLKSLLDDERMIWSHQGTARPGQAAFREALRDRYGDRCMISGCQLLGVVEAAHIVPYSKSADHHPANGLLLRVDIHSLYDLHMLGIEPKSLAVSVHADAKRAGYDHLDGQVMHLATDLRPNRHALELRWSWFLDAQS